MLPVLIPIFNLIKNNPNEIENFLKNPKLQTNLRSYQINSSSKVVASYTFPNIELRNGKLLRLEKISASDDDNYLYTLISRNSGGNAEYHHSLTKMDKDSPISTSNMGVDKNFTRGTYFSHFYDKYLFGVITVGLNNSYLHRYDVSSKKLEIFNLYSEISRYIFLNNRLIFNGNYINNIIVIDLNDLKNINNHILTNQFNEKSLKFFRENLNINYNSSSLNYFISIKNGDKNNIISLYENLNENLIFKKSFELNEFWYRPKFFKNKIIYRFQNKLYSIDYDTGKKSILMEFSNQVSDFTFSKNYLYIAETDRILKIQIN